MAYQQVKLKHDETKRVAWIPQKFAEIGKQLVFIDDDRIWKVELVYHYAVVEEPIYPEHLIREHRKHTGDSLPRRENE